VLSGRGLCDGLITRPEESYRLWCVVVCDLETSRIGAPYIYDISNLRVNDLTLILLTWRKWQTPNTASKWQMGFNSAFKGLTQSVQLLGHRLDDPQFSSWQWQVIVLSCTMSAAAQRHAWPHTQCAQWMVLGVFPLKYCCQDVKMTTHYY